MPGGHGQLFSKLPLEVLPGRFAVCQLPPGEPMPEWAANGQLWSVIATEDELSIVCRESVVPESVKAQKDWLCLKVVGRFPFALTGILASVANPLAEANVPIFAISSFDTDYVLIPASHKTSALEALRAAGHLVTE